MTLRRHGRWEDKWLVLCLAAFCCLWSHLRSWGDSGSVKTYNGFDLSIAISS